MTIVSSIKGTTSGGAITLPSSLVEGNLILMVLNPYSTVDTGVNVTVNTSGWTKVSSDEYSFLFGGGLGTVYYMKTHIIYKKYVSGDTLDITGTGAYIIYQIGGVGTLSSDYITFVTGTGQPNGPSVTTPYNKNSWLSVGGIFGATYSITTPPTGYSSEDIQNNTLCSCIGAYLSTTGVTQNPGAWVISGVPANWQVATIGIPERISTDWTEQLRGGQECDLMRGDDDEDYLNWGDNDGDGIAVYLPDDWDGRTKPTTTYTRRTKPTSSWTPNTPI